MNDYKKNSLTLIAMYLKMAYGKGTFMAFAIQKQMLVYIAVIAILLTVLKTYLSW